MMGINNPVPTACVKRPTNNIVKFGAMALIVVPIVKKVITPINNCLVVNHCTNNADIGITIPITSMKPVAIHCTVGNVILYSCINVVKAIFSYVSCTTEKKAPMISEIIICCFFTLGSSAKYSYFLVLLLSIITPLYFIDYTQVYKFQDNKN